MRLLSGLLALLIAVSVVAAPLPGAFGAAQATATHAGHGAGLRLVEAACDAVQPDHHHGHAETRPASGDLSGDLCGDAAGGLDQAGCCEMAMCHPFLFAHGLDAVRAPPAAVSAAWPVETRLDDEDAARIERPPRA